VSEVTGSETPVGYFEERWGSSADPWEHARRWSEARKYDLTVAALPGEHYRLALEPACGAGLLTTRLAAKADRVTASDRFPEAVAATSERCRSLLNVTAVVADVRVGPSEPADLVVISEVLYYFDVQHVHELLRTWSAACEPGGHLVLVHYRPVVPEHVLTGDDVHMIARDVLGDPLVALVDPTFRLDVFAR
jgi:SAM-dependent methyltransferase